MRLLLLLSAFLTALTGAVTGTAASAQPVQASASASSVRPGVAANAVAPLADQARAIFVAPGQWRTASYAPVRSQRTSYRERRRE